MQGSDTKVIDFSNYSIDELKTKIETGSMQWDAVNEQGENLPQQALKEGNKEKIELFFKEIKKLKSKDIEIYKSVINYQIPFEKKYYSYDVMQPEGMTVLMYAIKYYLQIIDDFLEFFDLDLNITNSNGHNAAAFACANPFVEFSIIEKLIEIYDKRQVSYYKEDSRGRTILMNAIIAGKLDRVQFLNHKTNMSLLRKSKINWGPLHFAARAGNQEVLKYIIKKMPSEDIQEEMFHVTDAGISVLALAAIGATENDESSNYDTLKYLITNYFSNTDMLYARSNVGFNLLHSACTLCMNNPTEKMLNERNKSIKYLIDSYLFNANDLSIGVNINKLREQTITSNLLRRVTSLPGIRYDTSNLNDNCRNMISTISSIISNTEDSFSAFKESKKCLDEYYECKKYSSLCYKMETPLAVAIRFGNVLAINVLLEHGRLFDLTAFCSITRLENSNHATLPSVVRKDNRYIETKNLLIEKQLIKYGENGELVPCDVDKLLSDTSTILDAVDMENYIRAKDVYDKKYGPDSRDRVYTGTTQITNVSKPESLSGQVKKN